MGLYVSTHPLKNMENYFAKNGILIKDLQNENGKFEEGVSFGGIVSNFIKRTTKNGDAMCVLSIEDTSGKIDVVVFPRAFSKYIKEIENAEILLIKGKWDLRHGQVQIIGNSFKGISFEKAKKISAKLPKYVEKEQQKKIIDEPYIVRLPVSIKKSKMKKIDSILKKHKGNLPVEIRINGEILPYPHKIHLSKELESEIHSAMSS